MSRVMAVAERVEVEFVGGPLGLAILKDALRNDGLTVEHEPPLEERGAGDATLIVLLSITGNLATEVLKAAVRAVIERVRNRVPHSKLTILEPRGDSESWGFE